MELQRLLELAGMQGNMLVEANMQTAYQVLGHSLGEVFIEDQSRPAKTMIYNILRKSSEWINKDNNTNLADLKKKILSSKEAFDELWGYISRVLETDKYTFIIMQWYVGTKKKPKSLRIIEDVYRVKAAIELKNRFKATIDKEPELHKYRDLNAMTFPDLEDLADILKERKTAKQYKSGFEKELIETDQVKVFYNDKEWKVVIPKSEEAAKYYGQNTRWCTAADEDNMYLHYASDGDLYVFLHKSDNLRWQMHFETGQFMDAKDNEIDDDDIELLGQIFYKVFPNVIDNSTIMTNISNRMARFWIAPFMESDDAIIKYIKYFSPNPFLHKHLSDLVQLAIVRQNGEYIELLKPPFSDTVILHAISDWPKAIEEIEDPTEQMQMLALKRTSHSHGIGYIKRPTPKAIKYALEADIVNLADVKFLTPELARFAKELVDKEFSTYKDQAERRREFYQDIDSKTVDTLPY